MTALVKCRASSAAAVSLTRIDDHSHGHARQPHMLLHGHHGRCEVTDEGTREFLRNYMTELHAFIVRMLTVLPRNV
jgi:hypothetical protein